MSPGELRAEAIGLLNDALQKPPAELKAEVDVAEAAIARLRDEPIDRLRAGDASVQPALDNVNAVLSLVVGIEYPAEGVQRQLLQQAHDALQAAPV